jgi:small subunit ribosomal protein S9
MAKTDRYYEAVGRRKTATARVRIKPAGKEHFIINGEALEKYFPTAAMRQVIKRPIALATAGDLEISAKLAGGGLEAQAAALAHGLSRALTVLNPEYRAPLKKAGELRRDPRAKERRKFGLKKARKSPQWSKR